MWLGHASFFIRLNGVSILTDPIFGKPPIVKRYVDVPTPIDLIRSVDYVLLSHDHRDHMDENTLRAVAEKFPNAKFLAGLRSEDVLNSWKTPTNPVQTAGWFQKFDLNDQRLEIYFLPVRHWSRRGLFDTNWRLWGGYVVKSEAGSIYFGGDSGYGRHYREAGELFPNLDYFLVGIGAYEPRWFMEASHNNPADAIKAFQDLGARFLVPMHYGTFDLSDEPPSQPLRFLQEEAEKNGVADKVRPLAINGVLSIE
jgi:L-ascorbate metabolism protein UlaG (beta-lactamase superfamily)